MTQALDGWPERYTKTVAAEVRRYREQRGLSAQQFADACTAVGVPMKRSVIANFENGRRASVGVDELLAFARVLDIPPIYLMVPVGRVEWVEMQPGMESDPYRVAMWISGEVPFSDDADASWPPPLPKFRRIMRELKVLRDAIEGIERAEQRYAEIGMTAEEAERATERALQEIRVKTERVDRATMEYGTIVASGDKAAAEDARNVQHALMSELFEAQRVAEVASSKQVAVRNRLSLVETWRREREQTEEAIRRDLSELRAGGWELPKMPEEYRYLLEPANPSPRRSDRG